VRTKSQATLNISPRQQCKNNNNENDNRQRQKGLPTKVKKETLNGNVANPKVGHLPTQAPKSIISTNPNFQGW